MFKFNNKDTRTMLMTVSGDVKTGVFIVNVEYNSHLFLMFLLLTLNK